MTKPIPVTQNDVSNALNILNRANEDVIRASKAYEKIKTRRAKTLEREVTNNLNKVTHISEKHLVDLTSAFQAVTKDENLPQEGTAIIGYKKVFATDSSGVRLGTTVLKLLIPAAAKRVKGVDAKNHVHHKCRASKALVLEVVGEKLVGAAKYYSSRQGFQYHIGKIAKPDKYADNSITCAAGIHFFLTQKAASYYNL